MDWSDQRGHLDTVELCVGNGLTSDRHSLVTGRMGESIPHPVRSHC